MTVASRRPPTAAKVWSDLVQGRLVVLSHHDADGRRYLHVQPRREQDLPAGTLTDRERLVVGYRAHGQGLKRIAFELGVSVPTIARCLASAREKLQLQSDMQLPALFALGSRFRG